MRKLINYAVLVLFLVRLVNAADVSGKWRGSLEGQGEDGATVAIPAHAELKQAGGAITGTVWKDASHVYAIEKGKIGGNQINFEFTAPEGSEGRLEGEIQFEVEGAKVAGKLKLTRDK
jgi:hypothetical protein